MLDAADDGRQFAGGGQSRVSHEPAAVAVPSCTAALTIAVLLSLPYVFFTAFSHMSSFDDEGTLMVGFRSLLEGHRMYDEIYSLYGPLYNGVYRLIYVVLHVPLTHTTARVIAAALWVGYSAAFALVVFRMTGSRIAALAGYAVTLIWLSELMHSPGHPEELSLLMLAGLLLAIGSIAHAAGHNARLAAAACAGGLAAGLVLVKINVGVFAGECLLLMLVRLTAPNAWTRMLTVLLGLLLIVTPVAVATLLLDQGLVRVYVGFATLTIAATLLVSLGLKLPIVATRAEWIAVVAGGLAVIVVVLAGTLLAGSSAHAVFDAVVLQNARFMRNWYIPLKIGYKGGLAALLSLGGALVYRSQIGAASDGATSSDTGWRTYAVVLAKLAFVVGVLAFFGSPGMLFRLLTPFVWLLVAVPAGTPPTAVVLRAATAMLGALLALYPFPVAGHQIDIGALVCVIAVPVLGYDVLTWARARLGNRVPRHAGRWAMAGAAAILLLVDGAVTFRTGDEYRRGELLGLPGTALVRLPPDQAQALRWVTAELHSCQSSYSLPGLLSFAFWTGHPLPTPMNVNDVLAFIRDDQQAVIVDALRRSPDLCIVYSDPLLRFLDRGQIARDPPLLHYVRTEFAVAAVHGRYAILKRRPKAF